MKFGKQIQFQQIPEWQGHYMSYKGLKKIINSLVQEKAQVSISLAAAPPIPPSYPSLHGSAPHALEDEYQTLLQSQKAEFFFKLERELEKVNSFYLLKESELKVRLRSLIDKEKVIIARQGRPGTSSSLNSLKEAFRQFEQDLNKLQKFVETNGTGFRKILKKWDKRSKSSTKELYLSRQVDLQPCFNQDTMVELADGAAYHLLALENLQQGCSAPSSAASSPNLSIPQSLTETSRERSLPMQQHLDELETDLFLAMMSNHASLVQEILDRRFPSAPLSSVLSPNAEVPGNTDVSETGSHYGGHVRVEHAREVVSRVFWRCCSELAVSDGILQKVIESNFVNFKFVDDISDRTCLHEASMVGRLSLIKLGVENGVSPECTDIYGRRPLHYVSMYGFKDCATYLLSVRADMTATDHDGFQPLIYSIMNGHASCVEIFLAHHAEIEASQEGDPIPLGLACHYGHEDIAVMLIKRGANVVASNVDGLEPLHITCREGHIRLTRMLTARGACVDQEDKFMCWTPLFYAASEGHAECVKILLEAGCRVDVVDEHNKSPLFYAASQGHVMSVELLIMAGAKTGGLASKDAEDASMDFPAMLSTSNLKTFSDTALPPLDAVRPVSDCGSDDLDDVDMNLIPSLSLPPPIIPFRVYGHSYLDKKFQVNLTLGHPNYPVANLDGKGRTTQSPVNLYGTAPTSSLKLIIKSRPDNGMIPHNVILPQGDDRTAFGFQVESLESFSIEFDIFPTFGSRAIGRAVALPNLFTTAESSFGKTILPLLDAHLKLVGEIAFEYSIVRPFQGVRLEVGGRLETYWKSTNRLESHLSASATSGDVPAPPVFTATTPSEMLMSNMSLIGEGEREGRPFSPALPLSHQPLVPGNAIPSFITASSLSGEYIQISIQMTRDLVPVVYSGWHLPVPGFDVALSDVSFGQFKRFGEKIHFSAEDLEASGEAFSSRWTSGEWRRKIYERWMSLEQVLRILPRHIGVHLELKYPTLSERNHFNLKNVVEFNQFIDTILKIVYESSPTAHHRRFMFSSFNPVICSALNWKQPNYAVFFNTYGGYNQPRKDLQDQRVTKFSPAAGSSSTGSLSTEISLTSPGSNFTVQPPSQTFSPSRMMNTSLHSNMTKTAPSLSAFPYTPSTSSSATFLTSSSASITGSTSTNASTAVNTPQSHTRSNNPLPILRTSSTGTTPPLYSHCPLSATVPSPSTSTWWSDFLEDDKRCTSIKEAVKFARTHNLLGLICEATPLIQVPSLMTHIKESGLLLATFGDWWNRGDPDWVRVQKAHGVDAMMVLLGKEGSPSLLQAPQESKQDHQHSRDGEEKDARFKMKQGLVGLGLECSNINSTTGVSLFVRSTTRTGGGSLLDMEEGVLWFQNDHAYA